ncbi:MAG TPA: hypothetical protein DEH78_20680 [Solibacterales bacterium]|nr:hypothetical protein [Bryobacterales bacterium]
MKLLTIAAFLAVVASTAFAQPFGAGNPPEAVRGQCQANSIVAGKFGLATCIMIPAAGGPGVAAVPEAKLLVIEDITIRCQTSPNDGLEAVSLVAGGYFRAMTPEPRGISNNKLMHVGSYLSRMYAGPGTDVKFTMEYLANVTAPAWCSLAFTGHYLDLK